MDISSVDRMQLELRHARAPVHEMATTRSAIGVERMKAITRRRRPSRAFEYQRDAARHQVGAAVGDETDDDVQGLVGQAVWASADTGRSAGAATSRVRRRSINAR